MSGERHPPETRPLAPRLARTETGPLAPRLARSAASPLAPRLARAFAAPRAQRAALIPYVTGGHPDLETSSRVIAALIDAGADIVELGIPFSDPIADGPVVQRSTHEALLAGVTPDDVLQLAAAHSGNAPFVLLTYVNTVLAFGPERFFARAAASGVEALVIPDLPLDEAAGGTAALAAEAGGLTALASASGVSLVPMATPTSTDERLDMVAEAATSFVYCVAVTGVTGARQEVSADLPDLVGRLRARTDAPLAVGFGISTPEQAARVAGLADGVIIGSALIDLIARSTDADSACRTVGDLTRAAARRSPGTEPLLCVLRRSRRPGPTPAVSASASRASPRSSGEAHCPSDTLGAPPARTSTSPSNTLPRCCLLPLSSAVP